MHESSPRNKIETPATDPLRAYLVQIGNIALLNRESEIEIAQRRDRGLEAAMYLEQNPQLPEQERFNKELEILDGAFAKEELIERNLRLVVSVAKRYQSAGIPLLDLIQEGNIGLMRAADKFDWKKGFKFSTYATWWIKQAVSRSIIDTGSAIRIPAHKTEELRSMFKLERELRDFLSTQELSDEDLDQELCELLGMKDVTKLEELRSINRINDIASLDKPIQSADSSSDSTLGDYVPDEASKQAFDPGSGYFPDGFEVKFVEWGLNAKEIEVMQLRLGLDGGEPLTLEKIGLRFNVTRERIRQIEAKAMRKIRIHALAEEARQRQLETGAPVTREAIEQEMDNITQRKRSRSARK